MKSIVSMIAVASAVVTLGVRADDIDDLLGGSSSESTETASSSDDAGETVESNGEAADGEATSDEFVAKKPAVKLFHLLPFCRSVEGKAEVLVPKSAAWTAIEDGKYYPLGTSYRTVGAASRLNIEFGPECSVEMVGEASFGTRLQQLEERVRAIDLQSGTITVKLPTQVPEGAFSVNAPGFTVKNPVGESRYVYKKTVDGDEALVRCVTQRLTLVGPNFEAPAMRAANEIKIVTSQDQLMTALYGMRGDFTINLDQGVVKKMDYVTRQSHEESNPLEWKLSPQTVVRIHRALLPSSPLKAVTVMTFDARGVLHNRRAFTEKMVYVNSGELGPTSKKDREALAKRAAEIAKSQEHAGAAAETRDADVAVEEASAEESSSDSDDELGL